MSRRGKPWRLLPVLYLAANSFDLGRAFRRASRGADRLGLLVADRLRLRIADRLGQHLIQRSLARCGSFCHFATISISTSRLPWPGARPSIVRNFSRRLPVLSRIPLLPSVFRRAETPSATLVAPGPSLFYRSWITSNFSDQQDDDSAEMVCGKETR